MVISAGATPEGPLSGLYELRFGEGMWRTSCCDRQLVSIYPSYSAVMHAEDGRSKQCAPKPASSPASRVLETSRTL